MHDPTSSNSDFVPWGFFEWIVGGVSTALAGLLGMVLAATGVKQMLTAHVAEDDLRFQQLNTILEQLRKDTSAANTELITELRLMRSFFQDYLLKANVDKGR